MAEKQHKTFKSYCNALADGTLKLPFESSGSSIQDFYIYFKDKVKDNTIPENHIESAFRRKIKRNML